MRRRFENDGFEFDRLILLGGANRGLTDAGELLAAFDLVTDGDEASWVRAFTDLGERLETQAAASAAKGRAQSARTADLRACSYFATAASHAVGSQGSDAATALWERHRAAWDRAIAAFDPPVEKIAIPYHDPAGDADVELEGYFFTPTGSASVGERRPTLVLNNGSDGPVCDMWSVGAAAAVERGWNAVTYDGPGQGDALYRKGLHFRPDWEAVLTPVLDHVLERPDVDPDRVAVMGVSQAGYWVPRALAFEHRFAAGVADPGVTRVGDSWLSQLPEIMVSLLDGGDKADFDAFMEAAMKERPEAFAELRWRMDPYGLDSVFDAYKAAEQMHLDAATLQQISTPLLITSPEHEQFWPGQSEEMHQLVSGSTLVRFTEAEGASWHCEPAARSLLNERVMDWLADVFDDVG
jgi:hypothetical protein